MPIIYLKHERHGAKVAISELEAAADEKNGWVRYTPEQPGQPSEPEPVVPNFLATSTRRKIDKGS